ncbi:MAG: hypothetical protein V4555_00685 [Acidobacteriota bacterium]
MIKRGLLLFFALIALTSVVQPATAQDGHHHRRHRHCWYSHHHRHCRWD